MKRGSRFFVEFSKGEAAKKKSNKGRSAELLKVRNDKIFHRYYYHSRILQLKYELVLLALSNEFDLSESTLIQMIAHNTKRVKEIGDKKMTRGQLKRLYPFFSWSDRAQEQPAKNKEVYNRY